MHIITLPPQRTNTDLIKVLEVLLDDAKSGKIVAMAYAVAMADSTMFPAVGYFYNDPADWHKLLAASSVLQARLIAWGDSEDAE